MFDTHCKAYFTVGISTVDRHANARSTQSIEVVYDWTAMKAQDSVAHGGVSVVRSVACAAVSCRIYAHHSVV